MIDRSKISAVIEGLEIDEEHLTNAEEARVRAHRFAEMFELNDEEREAMRGEVEAFIAFAGLPEPPDPLEYLRRLAGTFEAERIRSELLVLDAFRLASADGSEGEAARRALFHDPHPQPAGVSDEELFERIRRSKAAAAFEALWRGDWNGHPSASEADYELVRILLWFGATEAQAERLWLASGLGAREKVQRRADYRKRTIARAASVVEIGRRRYERDHKGSSSRLDRIPNADALLESWR